MQDFQLIQICQTEMLFCFFAISFALVRELLKMKANLPVQLQKIKKQYINSYVCNSKKK